MTTNNRRVAADARRIARETGVEDREQTGLIRELIRRNYERGLEEGRAQERQENGDVMPRTVLLNAAADILDRMEARTTAIPNSDRAISAYREASAILRDASSLGEDFVG
jgi:hypothetical protein